MTTNYIGQPQSRVDGRAKVTGEAKYAAEYNVPQLLYGYIVSSAIAKGKIKKIDAEQALAVEGVAQVFTHENRSRTAWFDHSYSDSTAPPGSPFRPLRDEHVIHSEQPIALVVADSFELASYAASLVRVEYEEEKHETDLSEKRGEAYQPKTRKGIPRRPSRVATPKKLLPTPPCSTKPNTYSLSSITTRWRCTPRRSYMKPTVS